ncbi:hypothetical protein [Natrialba swarupiae]|uniref:Uncharacterized protein n=1 Tax=Natrialba swarupiae TaxID=2448032 RepID=A0A5D5ALX4_9EURY|nr:hypothetical protein [Natrialba swarupiae]TYT62074.1 hypothetical protein FYC77_10250 [Natrialba swarupiae]
MSSDGRSNANAMTGGGIVLMVLVFGLGAPLVLYLLIDAETWDPTVVDRETAEHEAKARGGLSPNGSKIRSAATTAGDESDRSSSSENADDDRLEYGSWGLEPDRDER